MKKILLLATFFLLGNAHQAQSQIITTVAGDSTAGYNGDNISAITAELFQPVGIAIDGTGNIYIGDRDNNRIRKVNTAGIITTIAGIGSAGFTGDNGPATAAELNEPIDVAIDGSGNVYFSDVYSQRVRKINTSGIITTIAGTDTAGFNEDNIAATMAKLNFPQGIAVDGNGNVFIADYDNNRIRKVNSSGIITTVAGTGTGGFNGDNGPATDAEIYRPYGIALDVAGNIYIADCANNRLRKVSTSGIITTVAGSGTPGIGGDGNPATAAELNLAGVGLDSYGNIYITDPSDNIVRKVDASGIISTIAGTGGSSYNGDDQLATLAEISEPTGVVTDNAGNVYICDLGNNRIRRITSTVFVYNVIASNDIELYPNPSNGLFTFNLSSNNDEQAQLIITNIAGEKVKEVTTTTNTLLNIQLNVPTGIYFLTAITAHGRWSEKLIVEHTT